jgi:hypothetical protein
MTQTEQNKLIAEFMGIEKISYSDTPTVERFRYGNSMLFETDLKYHTSWDWLMPVVEKIQSIDITPAPNYRGYRIEIVPSGYVSIKGFPMPPILANVSIEGSLINAVYQAVIQFVEWYNLTTLNKDK